MPGAFALAFLAAPAGALAAGADVGGYMRVMTRPDLQGGDGSLGYWNLYGRLLNEGPWVSLDLRVRMLDAVPGGDAPWTDAHFRVEGGSIANADPSGGSLDRMRLSQAYVEAGNVLLPHVTWQIGTLESWFGDLGLYDWRPSTIFYRTLGVSGRYEKDGVELLLGAGDAGYGLKPDAYDTVLSPGGSLRVPVGGHLELGLAGEGFYEPALRGNRNAPHVTPDLDYEDWLRGEVVKRRLEEHPTAVEPLGRPVPVSASSWAAVGYLGFGDLGPLVWNNLFLRYERLHPEATSTETWDGVEYTLYVTELTDQRYQLTLGDEADLRLLPGRLDAAWAWYWSRSWDLDNTIAPSDRAMELASTVLRLQLYLSPVAHLLAESSAASELSLNGNRYRDHADSVFQNTGGMADSRGLEYGDDDRRLTWQGKAGVVLNPLGEGIYVRPSLRLLYGIQYSTQNNAFGNSFVESLDQYNTFGNVEQHWHQVLSVEAEAWF